MERQGHCSLSERRGHQAPYMERQDALVKRLEAKLRVSMVTRLDSVPSVAVFDLRYPASLPPIQSAAHTGSSRAGSGSGRRETGDGEEEGTAAHYR